MLTNFSNLQEYIHRSNNTFLLYSNPEPLVIIQTNERFGYLEAILSMQHFIMLIFKVFNQSKIVNIPKVKLQFQEESGRIMLMISNQMHKCTFQSNCFTGHWNFLFSLCNKHLYVSIANQIPKITSKECSFVILFCQYFLKQS